MKATSFFFLGVLVGAFGVLVVEKVRRDQDPENVELLSRRMSAHLNKLETRLEAALKPQAHTA